MNIKLLFLTTFCLMFSSYINASGASVQSITQEELFETTLHKALEKYEIGKTAAFKARTQKVVEMHVLAIRFNNKSAQKAISEEIQGDVETDFKGLTYLMLENALLKHKLQKLEEQSGVGKK